MDYGKEYTWDDAEFSQDLSVENIVEQNYYTFRREYDELSDENPESFCGEIHDIRIYSSILTQEKLVYNSFFNIFFYLK